jgi:hypothetical protein
MMSGEAVIRVQIQFTEPELLALRSEASSRGVSVSAVVREAVDASLARRRRVPSREELRARAIAACGQFRSGLGDVSARHDAYFADSLDE